MHEQCDYVLVVFVRSSLHGFRKAKHNSQMLNTLVERYTKKTHDEMSEVKCRFFAR